MFDWVITNAKSMTEFRQYVNKIESGKDIMDYVEDRV